MKHFCGTGWAVLFLAASASAVTNVSLYQRVEETMVNSTSFGNPFTQTELRLAVAAPAGRTLGTSFTWYGFHDGNGSGGQAGNVWKFRILLDCPGTWTVDAGFYVPGTSTANGPSQQFTYEVSATPVVGEHGHVRVDSQNYRRLRYDDGTPWVPFAIHSSGLIGRDQTIARQWIDEHAALNVDALAVRFHSEANGSDPERYHFLLTNGTSGTSWPPNGTDGFDYVRYDIGTWRYNEQIIDHAMSRGVKLSIWFGISGLNDQYNSYGPRDYPNDSTLGANQKGFIRYFLSRWAPYTCWWHWTVDSEYEEGGGGALTRVRTYAAELQSRNPWKTPITTHVLSNWSPGDVPELDIATIQRRVDDTDAGATDCRQFVLNNDDYGKPVYNAEGVWSMSSTTRARVATLAHLMSGGFSHIAHGEGGSDPLASSWAVTWDHANPRHKQDAAELGKLSRFFNLTAGIDIGQCVPHNELVTVAGGNLALCLADPGYSYCLWLDRGGTATVSLAGYSANYNVTRYLCRDLLTPAVLPVVAGGGARSLGSTPLTGFGNDYLFVITRVHHAPGDFDGDTDVDQQDFGHLQACLSGSEAYATGCDDADFARDGDVDAQDLAQFIDCFSGPNVPTTCP